MPRATIDSQVAELQRFAREKEWKVLGVYKDEGWSGGILARPDLDRLRDEASKGVFSIVLVNDVDRLARDVTHLGVIKRDLERNGVEDESHRVKLVSWGRGLRKSKVNKIHSEFFWGI
jgi:site-specific DNA recombinase